MDKRDTSPKGIGLVIAADDGGLYEISQDDLIRAAKKIPETDPGYRILQNAAEAGLENAVVSDGGDTKSRAAYFVCKTFSQCANSKNFFINVRGLDAASSEPADEDE